MHYSKTGALRHIVCCIGTAAVVGCQAASPGLQPAERRALDSMFAGTWHPQDRDVDLAIAGDTAALHRVLSRSIDPKLDGEALEGQCYYLLHTLFAVGDHRFAEGLRRESQQVRNKVLFLLQDTFHQLDLRLSYPETQSLATHWSLT